MVLKRDAVADKDQDESKDIFESIMKKAKDHNYNSYDIFDNSVKFNTSTLLQENVCVNRKNFVKKRRSVLM
jgi:hypothetical protein